MQLSKKKEDNFQETGNNWKYTNLLFKKEQYDSCNIIHRIVLLTNYSLLSNNGGNGKLCQVLDDYLAFIRNNSEKLYYSGQDTDKKAREALLLLETQRKEQNID